jgi:hypothetical protein
LTVARATSYDRGMKTILFFACVLVGGCVGVESPAEDQEGLTSACSFLACAATGPLGGVRADVVTLGRDNGVDVSKILANIDYTTSLLKSSASQAAIKAAFQATEDSLSDLSTEEALRLQMAMDQRSKFIETLSNIMKKISTTADGIISNIK